MGKTDDYLIEYEGSIYDAFPTSHEVFVLGAGFSKAVTSEMPTMAELTNKIKEEGLLDNHLANVTNFEIILNSLSIRHPWLSEVEYLRNRALYLEIARAITDIIRVSSRSAWRSPVPEFLRRIFDYWSFRRCTVITFNYDTLVESLFWSCKGYLPRPPETLVTADIEGAEFSKLFGDFTLLKLHGSINWLFSGNTEYENEPILYYRPYDPRASSASEDARDDSFIGGKTQDFGPDIPSVWDKEPFIVPPLVEKAPFFQHRVLRNQWVSASHALQKAKRIFFIGYSMPLTDLTVRYLLMTAGWSKESENVSCVIVDRDKKVLSRYEDVLGTKYGENKHNRFSIEKGFWGNKSITKLAMHLQETKREGIPEMYGMGEEAEEALKSIPTLDPSDSDLEALLKDFKESRFELRQKKK